MGGFGLVGFGWDHSGWLGEWAPRARASTLVTADDQTFRASSRGAVVAPETVQTRRASVRASDATRR